MKTKLSTILSIIFLVISVITFGQENHIVKYIDNFGHIGQSNILENPLSYYFPNSISIGCSITGENDASLKLFGDIYFGQLDYPEKFGGAFHSINNLDFFVDPLPMLSKHDNPYYNKIFSLYFQLPFGNIASLDGKLITNTFQLKDGAGLNKVLLSDETGNGIWTNYSNFITDDWQFNADHNLVANALKIGVGTNEPLQTIHCNGNLLVSGPADRPNSILFANSEDGSHLDWGICNVGNGLDFYKFQMFGMNKFFIHEDGNIGIGFSPYGYPVPRARLEIVNLTDNKAGLIMNRVTTSGYPLTNEIQFHLNSNEQWAIGSHLDDQRPNTFFIWDHHNSRTAMLINSDESKIGIYNGYPEAKLDVGGDIKAQYMGLGMAPPVENSPWRLFVEGGIKAREIKVTVQNFSDYVFDEHYKLTSIHDLKKFIDQNKHLPGIPSSEDVKMNDGIDLGSMQVKLLAKIEEQSLYIIELQKQIDEMKAVLKDGREE